MITLTELRAVMPRLPLHKAQYYLPFLQKAMEEFEINTYLREASFLAQIAHESGEFRWMEELASGHAYEGRKDLGNVRPGDGKRYKGRGVIQLTGRANYQKYGKMLNLPLEEQPELAATPVVAFRVAALFWKSHGLNEMADNRRFNEITRRINGGFNGLEDRKRYYERALLALSRNDEGQLFELYVNGEKTELPRFQRAGRTMVGLRSFCKAIGARVLEVMDDTARVELSGGKLLTVPLFNEDGTGYTPISEFPGRMAWTPATRTVRYETP